MKLMEKIKRFFKEGVTEKYMKTKTVLTILVLNLYCAVPVRASADVVKQIDNIYALVVGIITAIGAVVLAIGAFEFAIAYQQHDSSQQTQALKKIVSGIIMVCIGGVIAFIRNGA